ncbi:hypothetical protein NMY27_09740 [Cronobacter dublinensis subsp. beijingensis]|uniref:hypothetical protein n=1 Tax=Cronobacter dublinensis TaxID=413497 RepID=UPI0023DA0966|nr:hypothetical protein [Cronobacter dublinensis]WEP51441.1 hypothetical protein NMY27_09740 [Cronobacter dublinensis]
MNNDELIAAGHELAKCLDSNTPLIDIAKLLSKIATQLDVTTAALREKTKQCDALAAEVQAVRWACGQVYVKGYNHGHLNTVDGLDYASETELVERGGETLDEFTDPDHCGVAADAILREVRAQGVGELAQFAGEEYKRHKAIADRAGQRKWKGFVLLCSDFANQIRQGGAA